MEVIRRLLRRAGFRDFDERHLDGLAVEGASSGEWAVRHDLLDANPMDGIDTVKVPKRLSRPAAAGDVAKVVAAICPRRPSKDRLTDRLRERVLFEQDPLACGSP